jgi:hypothetical protein
MFTGEIKRPATTRFLPADHLTSSRPAIPHSRAGICTFCPLQKNIGGAITSEFREAIRHIWHNLAVQLIGRKKRIFQQFWKHFAGMKGNVRFRPSLS